MTKVAEWLGLQDMLTDACASCTPYCGGYAHWGMLKSAEWFVKNELENVARICAEHPGYKLLLVGHSLGAGELHQHAAVAIYVPAAAAALCIRWTFVVSRL